MEIKIKLGECPKCKSGNYTRDISSCEDDWIKQDCECQDCEEEFREYFQLDEVQFGEDEEEICYSNVLSNKQKKVLLQAMDLLISTEGDTKDHKEIIHILNGGLYKSN